MIMMTIWTMIYLHFWDPDQNSKIQQDWFQEQNVELVPLPCFWSQVTARCSKRWFSNRSRIVLFLEKWLASTLSP